MTGAAATVVWEGDELLRESLVPLDSLTLKHTVDAVVWRYRRALAESLREFGQVKPVRVDGRGRITAGVGVYLAAKELGWSHLAVWGSGPPRQSERVGRNVPCPCGSGVKFKRCHGA